MIALVGFATSARADMRIENARFGAFDPQVTRFVLELDQAPDFRAFHLYDPERIVIDIPQSKWYSNVPKDNTQTVKRVRSGLVEPGTSRLVLDLYRPAVIDNAFVLRASGDKPNRLVVDLRRVTETAMRQARDHVMGQREIPKAQASAQRTARSKTPEEGSVPAPAAKPRSTYKPLVVIDAGHGGQDPGAIAATGMFEKTITLKAARELRDALKATGRYRVHLTRDDDRFIRLRDRIDIARRVGGDLFISLHADSLNRSNVTGASVYTLSNTASDRETARLAQRENQADLVMGINLETEDEDVADILLDLARRDTMNQSKIFADVLVDSFRSNRMTILQNPHRFAGFAVLKAPDIPSVLIEMGYLSNKGEARRLATAGYRRKIMTAIVDGIDQFYREAAAASVF